MNPKTNVSAGELAFYEKIKTGEVRALRGKSDKGEGWRPVCRGHYLGSACMPTEAQAISKGKIFMCELKARVEGVQQKSIKKDFGCGACNDGCAGRKQCRVVEESPPIKPVKNRIRKSKAVAK